MKQKNLYPSLIEIIFDYILLMHKPSRNVTRKFHFPSFNIVVVNGIDFENDKNGLGFVLE